jgi:translation initiation factor 2 alpha subunit (eIF-2alpha)
LIFEYKNFIVLQQEATKRATPIIDQKNPTNNIPLRIKGLIAEKRRARSTWQKTHTPENNSKPNQISKKLKTKLQELKNESFENYFAGLTRQFLDIAQAFNKICHSGLVYKIKKLLPSNYYNLLKSYIRERSFVVKINEEISNRLPIHSGVPKEAC